MALALALAALFLALTPTLTVPGDWLTLSWCGLALALLLLARRSGQNLLANAAVALFAVACLRGMLWDLPRFYQTLRPWTLSGVAFRHAAAVRLIGIGALPATLTAAWRLRRPSRDNRILALILLQVWLYLTFEAALLARVFAPGFREGAVTLLWTLFAFALLFSGIRLHGRWLRWSGLGLFSLAVTKLLLSDLAELDTLSRIVAFLSTGVVLVLGSFVYLKYQPAPDARGPEAPT